MIRRLFDIDRENSSAVQQTRKGTASTNQTLVASQLLYGTCDIGEDIVGIRADKANRANHDHQNHSKHHCVLGDILTIFVVPKLSQSSQHKAPFPQEIPTG
jgi:hypothetical protein